MKRFVLLVLFSIFISGCGKGLRRPGSTEPEFNEYLLAFDRTTQMKRLSIQSIAGQINVEFGELRPGEHGRCEWSPFQNSIKIDRALWEQRPVSWRELLVFHEVGHCVLGLDHSEDPSDLMFHNVEVTHQHYLEQKEAMLDRFFSGVR